jgi:hypothetical protein
VPVAATASAHRHHAATAVSAASAETACQTTAGPNTRNGATLRATGSAPSRRTTISTATAVRRRLPFIGWDWRVWSTVPGTETGRTSPRQRTSGVDRDGCRVSAVLSTHSSRSRPPFSVRFRLTAGKRAQAERTRSNLAKNRTCPCLRVPEPRLRRLATAKAGDELRCGRTSTYAASPRWMET